MIPSPSASTAPRIGARVLILPAALLLALAGTRCGDDDVSDAGVLDAGPRCGDGVLDPGEECDDGNQSNQDGCCNTCLYCPVCNTEAWDPCDATSLCCPTFEDVPTECAPAADSAGTSRCLPACDTGADCDWSNRCDVDFPGHCWPAWCGPAEDGSPVNGPCSVNGRSGYCYPMGTAEADYGLCIEPGTVAIGDACDGGYPLDETPRHVSVCDGGVCTHWRGDRPPQGLAFCDPVAAYDATDLAGDGCPDGYNCLNFSALSGLTGKRGADKGRCIPVPATDPDGLLSCDLLNGELIHDRTMRCPDLWPDSRCGLYRSGSLMGTCQTAEATALELGAACSAEATALTCGDGAACALADPFGTGDATDRACLEICDASTDWTCQSPGLACTSLSYGTEDASPTRLGYCAPPPPQP